MPGPRNLFYRKRTIRGGGKYENGSPLPNRARPSLKAASEGGIDFSTYKKSRVQKVPDANTDGKDDCGDLFGLIFGIGASGDPGSTDDGCGGRGADAPRSSDNGGFLGSLMIQVAKKKRKSSPTEVQIGGDFGDLFVCCGR